MDDAPLRRIAERLLHDPADREDALQDTWVTTMTAGPPAENRTRWQAGVLRHRAMKLWSRRRRRAQVEALVAAEPPPSPPEPADVLDRALLRELLVNTLAHLPDAQAEVIRARFFEERSVAEIAERLGRPVNTVKTQLSRGLAEMRRRLDQRTGVRELTALALIRGFDLPAPTAAPSTAPAAVPATIRTGRRLASVPALVGLFAVVLTLPVLWLLVFGGAGGTELEWDDPREPDLVASVDPPIPEARPRTPAPTAPVAGEESEVTRDASVAPTPEEPAGVPETMTVTLVGMDDAGTPIPGFRGRARIRGAPEVPFAGPAGTDGRLTLTVGEQHLWAYTREEWREKLLGFEVEGGRYVRISVECPRSARGPTVHVPFAPGTDREVEIRIDRAPSTIVGQVVDIARNPIEGVAVASVNAPSWREGDLVFSLDDDHRTTDAEGWFRFANLREGGVTLELMRRGFVPQSFTADVLANMRHEAQFVLVRAAPVAGVVRDESGAPVPGARVLADVLKAVPETWAVTDADGSFRLETLVPGPHRLWAYGPEGTPLAEHTATDARVLTRELTIWNPVLAQGARLHVDVVDERGDPVPGQLLVFHPEAEGDDPGWWDLATTDEAGRATLTHAPPGPICVQLKGGSETSGIAPVPFRVLRGLEAREEPYRVVLTADDRQLGSVRGGFVDFEGRPFEGGSLFLAGPLFPMAGSCERRSEAFEIEGLPAGDYELMVSRPFEGHGMKRFRLGPGEELDLGQIPLPEPGTLRVINTWRSSGGDTLDNVAVIPLADSVHGPMPLTGGSDYELFEGDYTILPGDVQVVVYQQRRELSVMTAHVRSGEVVEVTLDPSLPNVFVDDEGD